LLSFSGLVLVPSATASASATCGSGNTSKAQVLNGVGQTSSGSCSGAGVTNLVSSIVSILSIVVGVVAVIMIIYGALRYITSAGDSGKVASAKSTLIYALVGLAIAALAQVIVHDVLNTANKAAKAPAGIVINSDDTRLQ
jgi:uncharacterized membrane protein